MRPGLAIEEVLPLLRTLAATDAVLIGGQALQVWCDRYASAVADLRSVAPFTSGDVDVQGDRRVVEVCAQSFAVRPAFPTSFEDATNVGYLEVSIGAVPVGVNVLTSPYGIDAREAMATARMVDLGDGSWIRVLHPVLCMESRIANVGGLGRTSAKELHQARASILCARALIAEVAASEPRAALDLSERVFRYARKNLAARKAFREHGLDTFDAIEAHPGLPDAFVRTRLPQMRSIIASSRRAD